MRIALTLVECDIDRYLRLQRPTFERWYADLDTTLIVTRPGDVALIRAKVSHLPGVDVIDEREFVPESRLQWDPRPKATARRREPSWFFQQLVKLAVTATLDDEFVLLVDGDVIAVSPVCDADLVENGRALRPVEPVAYPAWIMWAAQTLGVDPIDYQAAVTPSVLAPKAVRLLAEFVESHVPLNGPRLRTAAWIPGLRGLATSWRGRLLGHKWTEYQLYDTFLVTTGQFDAFHRPGTDRVLSSNEVHRVEDFADWEPTASSGHPRYFFSVVQSRAGIPVDAVEARLRDSALI